MKRVEDLTAHERACVNASLLATARGDVRCHSVDSLNDELAHLWMEADGWTVYHAPPSPTVLPVGWLIGMSKDFKKAVVKVDSKLRGRILTAITQISTEPTKKRGDTVKPLTADFDGLWCFRIGDYRLIYYPDVANKQVVLVSFASRSSAYA